MCIATDYEFHLSATSGMKLDRHYNIYSATAVTTYELFVHSKSLHALHHFSDLFLDDERININHYILCIKYFHSYYTINKSVYI